ncbi:hypothetical protein BASA50_005662 [Batrachochytrium salamandrivorans]|uniref:Sas10 C-terminal domain-containing protein n=1 Tax=Batrachochytrium salamandrivorans TaxID=1357716 RepID=A0ABQ8FF84_9FUNG|nr:hypothetical protein BASA62_008959 [Batrachochytrium salamandrivorans]KAH6584611.1 hypothetical protein BASA61_007357 [Batrachochytrium salamandrivorans]KAH6595706.1 hypothetical protein BASA50_005662 [Batrachochytrium salamandrivorans]
MARKGRGRRGGVRATADEMVPKYTETSIADIEALDDNSEDEFHKQRGSVDINVLGRRKHQDLDSDEEVLALEGLDSDESDDGSDEEMDEEMDEDEKLLDRLKNYGGRGASNAALSGENSDDEEADQDGKKKPKTDVDGGWGTSRRAYYDGDDVSEEEDAKEEEREAMRLQKEQIETLVEGDFLEDSFENLLKKKRQLENRSDDASATKKSSESHTDLSESISEQIKPDLSCMSESDKAKLARSSNPEVVALLKEFRATLAELENEPLSVDQVDPTAVAQLARYLYLTNIAFYFALAADSGTQSYKSHPVTKQLAILQDLVAATAPGLGGSLDGSSADDSEDDLSPLESLEESDSIEASESEEPILTKKEKLKKQSKRDETVALNPPHDEGNDFEVPIESYNQVVVPKVERKRKRDLEKSDLGEGLDDFGEGAEIGEADLIDKLQRKKSLKFIVNRIEQSVSSLNIPKRKVRVGGDDDIPIRDVKAGQQAAQNKALKLSQGDLSAFGEDDFVYEEDMAGGNSDSGDSSTEDIPEDHEEEGAFDEEGERLYEEMAAQKKDHRDKREAQIQMSHAEMEMHGDVDTLLDGTKRTATWKILANKGLTPHRKKENRNPRVKKRMKYEAAKKKLSSVRRVAVDKTKIGSYAGEATGINMNRSSSIRFN